VGADDRVVIRMSRLGELTASIAHEVNQPLGAIMLFSAAASRIGGKPAPEPRRSAGSPSRKGENAYFERPSTNLSPAASAISHNTGQPQAGPALRSALTIGRRERNCAIRGSSQSRAQRARKSLQTRSHFHEIERWRVGPLFVKGLNHFLGVVGGLLLIVSSYSTLEAPPKAAPPRGDRVSGTLPNSG